MGLGVSVSASVTGMAGLLGLTKARLNVYAPIVPMPDDDDWVVRPSSTPEQTFEFDYNPETLKFYSAQETHPTGNTAVGGSSQPGATIPTTTDFELLYSIFEVGDLLSPSFKYNDLSKMKDDLLALCRPHPSTTEEGLETPPHPPLVDFAWGDLITDPCLVTKVEVVYTHMLPDGKPVRMTARVTLEGLVRELPGTNPTSGGRTNRKTHTLLAGETLASVAFSEFHDAALWRAIAEENEIDDPMRLVPGSVLLLPSFRE